MKSTIKKFTKALLLFAAVSVIFTLGASAEKLGEFLTTDMVLKINNYPVQCYTFNGEYIVKLSDIEKAGFSVGHSTEECLRLSLAGSEPTWLSVHRKLPKHAGEKVGDVYRSDKKVFLNMSGEDTAFNAKEDKYITAYSLSGSTAVLVKELAFTYGSRSLSYSVNLGTREVIIDGDYIPRYYKRALIGADRRVKQANAYASSDITKYNEDGVRSVTYSKQAAPSGYTQLNGWYDYPVITMYHPDGSSKVVKKSDAVSWTNKGWYVYPVTLMYANDGRTNIVLTKDVAANKKVGWYESIDDVRTMMYANDGRSKYFWNSQVAAQKTVGWYTSIDDVRTMMYTKDGRSKYFWNSQVAAQKTVGWYTSLNDVQTVLYAKDGRTAYFWDSQVKAQKTVGWYDTPQCSVVSTYISAKINNYDIEVKEIGGKLIVSVSDLAKYGFKVKWNDAERAMYVTRDTSSTKITADYTTPQLLPQHAGQKLRDQGVTTVRVYLDGKQVASYNTGKVGINFEDLQVFGTITRSTGTVRLDISQMDVKDREISPYLRFWNDFTTVYYKDGSKSATVGVLEVKAPWDYTPSNGWYTYPVCVIYHPDGRSKTIAETDAEKYVNDGWYLYPVDMMYAKDGRSKVVLVKDVAANKKVGWYTSIDDVRTMMYTKDGRSKYFWNAQVEAQKKVGWYTEPQG